MLNLLDNRSNSIFLTMQKSRKQ